MLEKLKFLVPLSMLVALVKCNWKQHILYCCDSLHWWFIIVDVIFVAMSALSRLHSLKQTATHLEEFLK